MLSTKNSCSFPFPLIEQVNGIAFTYHSHLYCTINQWILLFIPVLIFLVSSFQLECFCLFCEKKFPFEYLSFRVSPLKTIFLSEMFSYWVFHYFFCRNFIIPIIFLTEYLFLKLFISTRLFSPFRLLSHLA